jgi:hypothetical protein
LSKNKKQEKLIKLLSALIYFDLKEPVQTVLQKSSLRQLQTHFANDEEPLSFSEYTQHLASIYRELQRQI